MRALAAFGALALASMSLVAPDPATADEETTSAPPVVAATWGRQVGEQDVLTLALYRGSCNGPATVYVCIASDVHGDQGEAHSCDEYGVFRAADWRKVAVAASELVRIERRTKRDETVHFAVATTPPKTDHGVHDLFVGDLPDGTFFYDGAWAAGEARVERNVVTIGQKVKVTLPPPAADDDFFRERTVELVRAVKRIDIEPTAPDADAGYVSVTWTPPEDGSLVHLEGAEGDARLRSHMDDPNCKWAERYAGWLESNYVIEMVRPAPVELTLDTSTVKSAGRVAEMWEGRSTMAFDSRYPNGIGGTHLGAGHPTILVIPADTRQRKLELK